MTSDPIILGAFILGLSGAGHCLGMCGGIAAALSLGGSPSLLTSLMYHLGRVASYTCLGGLLAYAAGAVDIAAWTIGLRYLAGFLLVAMGLYVADWWRGLAYVEKAGAIIWQPVQRLSAGLLPVRRWHQGLALGLCWGLMPCGLIYSALAWAATRQDALEGAVLMLLFGLGTLPAMLATSLGAARLQAALRRHGLKVLIGTLLMASGLWTLYMASQHAAHSPAPTHYSPHPHGHSAEH